MHLFSSVSSSVVLVISDFKYPDIHTSNDSSNDEIYFEVYSKQLNDEQEFDRARLG